MDAIAFAIQVLKHPLEVVVRLAAVKQLAVVTLLSTSQTFDGVGSVERQTGQSKVGALLDYIYLAGAVWLEPNRWNGQACHHVCLPACLPVCLSVWSFTFSCRLSVPFYLCVCLSPAGNDMCTNLNIQSGRLHKE